MRYGKSKPNYIGQHLLSESLVSVLSTETLDCLEVNSLRKLRKWRIANAKSRVDVGDRLGDSGTENIHTINMLVIGFRLAILR